MSADVDILAALDARPDDGDLRLIYADWLEERGDGRGAFLRAVVDLHRRPCREALRRACDLGAGLDGAWRTRVSLPDAWGVRFACVPAGTFRMGGGGGTAGERVETVAEDFCLGVYPVTQGQWQAVMGTNPSWFSRTGGGSDQVKAITDAELRDFPVEEVSWEDAREFIARLHAQQAVGAWLYRLPREAEWEYACRGGAVSCGGRMTDQECSFHFYLDQPTNSLSSRHANFDGKHPDGGAAEGPFLERTSQVGSYMPNRLGVYDLHGNVWEWCDDLWEWENGGSGRVIRGGCWDFYGRNCRAAQRVRLTPPLRHYNLGFRLARSAVR